MAGYLPDRLKTEHEGKTYVFCSDGCKEKFDKDPAKYALKPKRRRANRVPKMATRDTTTAVSDAVAFITQDGRRPSGPAAFSWAGSSCSAAFAGKLPARVNGLRTVARAGTPRASPATDIRRHAIEPHRPRALRGYAPARRK